MTTLHTPVTIDEGEGTNVKVNGTGVHEQDERMNMTSKEPLRGAVIDAQVFLYIMCVLLSLF